jgi:hypothetical protein
MINASFFRVGGVLLLATGLITAFQGSSALAAEPVVDSSTTSTPPPVSTPSTPDDSSNRYGPFGLFDQRSSYGVGVFPEPFLVDDSDLEVNEARVDWLHTEAHDSQSDLVTAEVEKGFGLVTLEVEVPYESDRELDIDPTTGAATHNTTEGMANVDLGARAPVYQYVSDNGMIDTTFGVAIEVGVPTNSPVSKNTEIVPKVFNDLMIADRFTLQSIIGDSINLGGGDGGGGLNIFEYGFVFGYTIQHRELPIPGVMQLIPVFELVGETQLNQGDAGHNSLTGNAAFRLNLKAIGWVQPRLGMGYVFPLNENAREDTHWGVVTSLVFEF